MSDVVSTLEPSIFTAGYLIKKIKNFPENIVITWHKQLFNVFKNKFISSCKSILHTDLFLENISFDYKGLNIGLLYVNMGAPLFAVITEELKVLGVKNILCLGNCGILVKDINTEIIVPTKAMIDEGTSYHYLSENNKQDFIILNNALYISDFFKLNGIPFTEGAVWTTDTPYRETKTSVDYAVSKGCICVDMECSAAQAVSSFLDINLYQIFLNGDSLSENKWKRNKLGKINKDESAVYLSCILALLKSISER